MGDASPSGPRGVEGFPYLSVVIPVFNERENISPLLSSIHEALRGRISSYEIVVVDDGSTDATVEALRSAQQTDPTLRVACLRRHLSQTAAMAAGFRLAKGAVITTLDGDLQNDPQDIPHLLELLKDWDAVCGIRAQRRDSWFRRLSSKIGNGFRNWVTEENVEDTGCTLKAYRRECVTQLELYRGLHRFLPTLLKMHGWRVTETFVSHHPRRAGRSKYNARNRFWKGLADTLAVRWMKKNRLALDGMVEVFEAPGSPPGPPRPGSHAF